LVAALLGLSIACGFALDCVTPPGVADGIGYAAVITFCLWLPNQKTIMGTAIVCTALAIIGQILSPPVGVGSYEWINRSFALATLWINATLLYQRKTIEQRLAASEKESREASVAKSKFVANMSHELRTPLNAILGFSEMMKIEIFWPLGEKYLGYAANIHSSAIHLLTLVNDVLDTAKIEARQYQASFELVDINDAAARACGLVAQMAASKNLAIPSHYADGMPKIMADRRLMHQTLLNLLSNAIKFTHGGGSVDVKSDHDGGAVRITIRDTGIGIPVDVLPRLCRPVAQASTDHAGQGSGLGLSLAKSFTEMQGRKFSIESVFGVGTTVSVSLPIARNQEQGTEHKG